MTSYVAGQNFKLFKIVYFTCKPLFYISKNNALPPMPPNTTKFIVLFLSARMGCSVNSNDHVFTNKHHLISVSPVLLPVVNLFCLQRHLSTILFHKIAQSINSCVNDDIAGQIFHVSSVLQGFNSFFFLHSARRIKKLKIKKCYQYLLPGQFKNSPANNFHNWVNKLT